ncbi:MAG: LPS-assembly protein LptD [Deltaproteobacteria bacterium]|nr:LPS-assembly protein LptD [Deltaproteobacteria bacterium]
MAEASFKRRIGQAFSVLVLSLYIFLGCVNSFAAGDSTVGLFKKDEPVTVTGDSVTYDKNEETYYAEGSVVVVQGATTLTADRVVLDMKAGAAAAWGGVQVNDASQGNYLKSNTLTVDINKDTAVAVSGRLFFTDGNVYIYGDVVRKTGPQTFDADNSVFTTCDCPEGAPPAWSFRSGYSQLEAEGYLKAQNAFFYIKDVPLLYTPYFLAPAKRKRQTGLLMPSFGYSDLRGSKMDNAFFWAISDSADATFYLDVETKRGVGQGLEYRYYRTQGSYGEFYFYHFGENDIDRVREFRSRADNFLRPFSAASNRWELKAMHREYLAGDMVLKADIDRVSDDEYFIDFPRDRKGHDRSYLESLESTASINKRWERYNLTAEARVFDNLFLKDDSTVLQVLPEVAFTLESRRVFSTPVFFSLDSSFVNFERGKGVDGERVDIKPRISLPLKPWDSFELTPSVSPRFTAYRVGGGNGESYPARSIYEFNIDAATTLVRYFEGAFGFEKMRHTIRPRLLYSYIPSYSQERFPDFTALDAIPPENSLRYSLNSTIAGKSTDGGKQDILYMDLFQTFDVREARAGNARPFSDLSGELIFTPAAWVSLRTRGDYNVYDGRFEKYNAEAGLNDTKGSEFSMAYHLISGSTKYIDARAKWQATSSVALGFRQMYSFIDTRSIERDYTLWYKHQCWSATVLYSEKLAEKVVMATFNLYGVGDVLSAGATVEQNR